MDTYRQRIAFLAAGLVALLAAGCVNSSSSLGASSAPVGESVAPSESEAPPQTSAPTAAIDGAAPVDEDTGSRWVRLEGNLLVDSVTSLMTTIRQARQAGADTVLFSDTKTSNWYAFDYGAQWLPKMLELQTAVRAEGMSFVVTTTSVGYCAPLLQIDPSVANTMPVIEAPMTVRDGALVADQTATLLNGSFERAAIANTPTDWTFQDEPGVSTFLDSSIVADGAASMRFEGANATQDGGMARISTSVQVLPFQQYVLRYKFRADALTANFLGPVVRGGESEITLTNQHPSRMVVDSGREYFQGATDLTVDWTAMEIAFNSREFDSVSLFLGVWDASNGTAWIDDVRIDPVPTLNVVRRDSLPITLTTTDGEALVEGVDVAEVSDPLLGNIEYVGDFDTYHDAPTIPVVADGRLREGDTVVLSASHAQLTASGQVGCAWNEPRTFELMREMHRQVATTIAPDGILIDLEETRTGGWEPTDAVFDSSGAALSNHVQRVLTDATAVVDGTPLYLWNDMLDPTMNARAHYYQIKGDLSGSWIGIDPTLARVINWRSGEELTKSGREGVVHFADLGFDQIVAGFYDEDVAANHAAWQAAIDGQPGIVGSMYTTWYDDFDKLDDFAALWWTN